MGILAFYIVNKSGGLVFNKDFSPHAPQMSTNAHLQLASTFFGCVPNRADRRLGKSTLLPHFSLMRLRGSGGSR